MKEEITATENGLWVKEGKKELHFYFKVAK